MRKKRKGYRVPSKDLDNSWRPRKSLPMRPHENHRQSTSVLSRMYKHATLHSCILQIIHLCKIDSHNSTSLPFKGNYNNTKSKRATSQSIKSSTSSIHPKLRGKSYESRVDTGKS
jgi:hypothetical protein